MSKRICILLASAMLLIGCESTNWRSSVPISPVHIEINTTVGMFVNFVPENITTYLIVNESGFFLNGTRLPLPVTDAYGYAGTVVYIDGAHPYGAYDLCCPHCVKRDKPCTIDGFYAICPECGEQYDIYSGNGIPTRGITKEPLKQYKTTYNALTGKLLVSQQQ